MAVGGTQRARWLAATALLLACSDSSTGVTNGDAAADADAMVAPDAPKDAAPEAGPDAPMDVAPDATPDAPMDAAPDAAPDATPDAAPDATPDAPMDAAPDAEPDVAPDAVPDAAPDAAPDATPDALPDAAPDVPTCATGQARCGDACVDLQTSGAHCGACGNTCAAGRSCVAGACALVCPTSQTACGDTCFDLTATVDHCGRCDVACSAPGGVARCAAGMCAVASCATGRGDCDGTAANGCEVDTAADVANCGRCGASCALANATPACRAGACAVASCATGFGDCDGMAANGCEVDTRTSAAHCGMCGRACAAGEGCRAGACVVVAQGTSCRAVLMATPGSASGLYVVDPDGDGALAPQRVYCDMTRDGGGWTLLEVGRALGTSLWTRNAVGVVSDPAQATSAKLSRDFAAAVLMAGTRTLRVGDEARYGELYLGPLDEAWIRGGLGATAFGTVVVGRRVAETLGGTQYDGSRFAWPLDGPPAACLNSDGSTSECGAGLHLGTWNHIFSYRGDEIYVNYSSRCCNLATDNGYRVWGR